MPGELRFLTDEPYELIVMDNGSTDGTVDWLKAQPDVRLIENAENHGFPAAVNQGIAARKASRYCCSITTRWSPRAGCGG